MHFNNFLIGAASLGVYFKIKRYHFYKFRRLNKNNKICANYSFVLIKYFLMRSKPILRIIIIFFLLGGHSIFSQEEEIEEELLPFDAVIESEMGGKRMKFYGNTRFNFNQAYFSNWISGGES